MEGLFVFRDVVHELVLHHAVDACVGVFGIAYFAFVFADVKVHPVAGLVISCLLIGWFFFGESDYEEYEG